jgi:hypothetical protein
MRDSEYELPRIPLLRTRVNSALEELEDGLLDRGVPFDSYVGYAFGDTCLSYLPLIPTCCCSNLSRAS